jgi:hypothetical protein
VRAVPLRCEIYPGICLTTEEKSLKTSVRVAARTSQADTVQCKNNEQCTIQKKTVTQSIMSSNKLYICDVNSSFCMAI